MSWETDYLEQQIGDVKELAVGTSRALRDLQKNFKGGPDRRSGEPDARPLSGREKFVRHAVVKLGATQSNIATAWDKRYNGGRIARATAAAPPSTDTPVFDPRNAFRAAAVPAMTSTPAYAGALSAIDLGDFLLAGSNPSLVARLAELAITVSMAGKASIKIPYRADATAVGGWVAEGGAIPAIAMTLATVEVVPHKVGVLSCYSQEIKDWSTPSIEQVLDISMRRDLNSILDASLVDAVASSSSRPAGLRNGVSTSTAGASMAADVKTLIAGLGTNAQAPVLLVGSAQAVSMSLAAAGATFPFPVLASPALTGGIVIALDLASFAISLSAPRIKVSEEAAVHLDTAAAALAADGATAISAPTRSMYQTDCFALRILFDVGWTVMPGRVAWTTATAW